MFDSVQQRSADGLFTVYQRCRAPDDNDGHFDATEAQEYGFVGEGSVIEGNI